MIKISRSKIDLFLNCPRCFYLDVVKKIKRPPGFPFNLNSAVDTLLKKEFDRHREAGTQHPIQIEFKIDAQPAKHPMIDKWRQSMQHGVIYQDIERDLYLYGGIDDLWVNSKGEYHVVDYKATAKNQPVTELADWTIGYKRQMEIYQWLLRKNGLNVSDTAYFVYCTGDNTAEVFDNKISFHSHIIPYEGDDSWIDTTISELHSCLNTPTIPNKSDDCEYCGFFKKLYTELKNESLELNRTQK
jgi:CRISPR/Cas system-associated exonuclease Cas4 (RecB family)